jgi:Ankyrin repeats (3 copies)
MSPEVNLHDVLQIEIPDHAAFEEDDANLRGVALLNGLQIASPCNASWEKMEGDDLVRFCAQCQQNVYNVSGMTRREAADLVREAQARLRLRFYRRRDGTLLSDNCPVGWRSARRWLLGRVASVSSILFTTAAGLVPVVLGLPEGFRQWGMAVELGQAIIFGDALKVETVLRAGADPNAAEGDDSLLLARGSPKGEEKIALLRRYGANPSRSLRAAHTVEEAQFLIGMGADPNARVGYDGQTPLAWHVIVANTEIVRFLLDHGGDPTVCDNDGQTILQRIEYAAGNHPERASD